MRLLKPNYPEGKIRNKTFKNHPINVDLVTMIEKSKGTVGADGWWIEQFPTIYFHGIEKSWTFDSPLKRDEEYNRIIINLM